MRFPNSLSLDYHGGAGINKSVFKVINLTTYLPSYNGLKKFGFKPRSMRTRLTPPVVKAKSFSKAQFNDLWTIHFLRKEYLYTKLKYSRTPSYDIVSGGLALLFAGLIGFLTTEKFGFELVDSGDFYIFGMYLILTIYPLRLLLKSAVYTSGSFHPLNYRGFISFVQAIGSRFRF